jgi:hypothetical protein
MNCVENWMVKYDSERRCDILGWKICVACCEIYKEDHYILLFCQLAEV